MIFQNKYLTIYLFETGSNFQPELSLEKGKNIPLAYEIFFEDILFIEGDPFGNILGYVLKGTQAGARGVYVAPGLKVNVLMFVMVLLLIDEMQICTNSFLLVSMGDI